ncbi:MAG TPA: hypothetical protein VLQ45_24520 [Thermoanaerobaculia bacterium]|nr:hypothetical protein [Thermoanaerobaculia bacterium]
MAERHYCLYPYGLSGLSRGWSKVTGMEALISREVRLRAEGPVERASTLICDGAPGDEAFELPEARLAVRPVPGSADPAERAALLAVWFDELWALLHPAAFTTPGLSPALAGVVYPDGEGETGPPGSFERIAGHVERRRARRLVDPEQRFADRFQGELDRLPADAEISWSEVFFTESILRWNADPGRRGSRQTLHSFLVIPDNLVETPPGRRILEALSAVDAVYLQTDVYLRRVARQLEAMELPVPELHRFDLPPDLEALRRAIAEPPPPPASLEALDPRQRDLVEDALLTRGRIPHRFVCPDRLDPIKGIHVVLEAVDRFLASLGQPIERLREQYRFYFVTDYYTRFPPVDRDLAWHRYADWIRERQIPPFQERWPGIVRFADNIPDRFIWTHLLADAHIISGGIQEGLGLAVQEGLVVNHALGRGRAVIMGDGAGFPIQAREDGLGSYGFFPSAGDPAAFAHALCEVVSLDAGAHRERTGQMVTRFIEPHRHRLLP